MATNGPATPLPPASGGSPTPPLLSPAGSALGRSASLPAGTSSSAWRETPHQGRSDSGAREMWAAAFGSGCYHYRMTDDWDDRHGRMEEKKWRNTNARKPPSWNEKFLHHEEKVKSVEGHDSRLVTYIVNGTLYSQGVWPSPPPEQSKKAHWLCQVNGSTNEYNIITGRKMNSHLQAARTEDVRRFRAASTGRTGQQAQAAGNVQPLPVVSSYDIQSFVPVYKHGLMGEAARNSSLSFLK